MRIMTRSQYNAIVDIVTEQQKRIREIETELEKRKAQVKDLEEIIKKKDECLDYCNEKLFERTRQVIAIQNAACTTHIDFPATTKQPEDKLF